MRPFIVSAVAFGLAGCTALATGPIDVAKLEGKPYVAMPFRQVTALSTKKEEYNALARAFPVVGIYTAYNPSGFDQDRSINYFVRCEPGAIDKAVGEIARKYKQQAFGSGSLKSMQATGDAARQAVSVYEHAQKKCGFNYRDKIQQLKRTAAAADANARQLFSDSLRQPRSDINIGTITSIIGGAAAIANGVQGNSTGKYKGGLCPESRGNKYGSCY